MIGLDTLDEIQNWQLEMCPSDTYKISVQFNFHHYFNPSPFCFICSSNRPFVIFLSRASFIYSRWTIMCLSSEISASHLNFRILRPNKDYKSESLFFYIAHEFCPFRSQFSQRHLNFENSVKFKYL